MVKSKNKTMTFALARNLYRMGSSSDWFDRSLILTRVCGLIQTIGKDMDTYFEMDSRYEVTDNDKFRIYKSKLQDAIEIEDEHERMDSLFRFYEWLHEIKLLKDC